MRQTAEDWNDPLRQNFLKGFGLFLELLKSMQVTTFSDASMKFFWILQT